MMTGRHPKNRNVFVERHGLWTAEQEAAATRVEAAIAAQGIEVVRLSFADQHGILRGKSIVAAEVPEVLRSGCKIVSTLLAKDTAHRTVYPVFTPGGGFGLEEMTGAGDVIMVPDPTTFRVLPWLEATAWLLCDIYFPNGRPVPFSTRHVARGALSALAEAGYDYVSGLEVEFHAFRLEDARLAPEQSASTGQPGQPAAAPQVSMVAHGFQHLTELRLDQHEPLLTLLRRHLLALGLPVLSLEVEYGPTQCEITFRPDAGLAPADMMVLFRSAAKQIARRHGYHISFMCRPGFEGFFASGWHLHQSLVDRKTGANAFTPADERDALSAVGRHFTGGLLRHARAAAVFTTPTINGYKRFRPYSLAPDRAAWSRDNRGAMVRAITHGPGHHPGSGRSPDPRGEPRRRAGGQPVPVHGVADPCRPRRDQERDRSRRAHRYAL